MPGCCCCMPLPHNHLMDSCSYVRKNTLLAAKGGCICTPLTHPPPPPPPLTNTCTWQTADLFIMKLPYSLFSWFTCFFIPSLTISHLSSTPIPLLPSSSLPHPFLTKSLLSFFLPSPSFPPLSSLPLTFW